MRVTFRVLLFAAVIAGVGLGVSFGVGYAAGRGNPKQAAACFERAIELNPQFYEKAVKNLRQARQALGNTANGTSASGSTDRVACP